VRIDAREQRGARSDVEIVRVRAVVEALAILRAADVDEAIRVDDACRRFEEQRVRDRETVVLAPIPMASDSAAVTAKTGLRRTSRAA
jgi:hypothetical protein